MKPLRLLLEYALRGIVAQLEENPRGIEVVLCRRDPRTMRWSRQRIAHVDAAGVRRGLGTDGALLLEIALGGASGGKLRLKIRGDQKDVQ